MKRLNFLIAFSVLVSLFAGSASSAFALTAEELKQALQEKAKAAAALESQKQEVNKKLTETVGQKKTLQSELKRIDYTINQLNLGIKSSEINIERLNLELSGLQLDINDITRAIETKKGAVIALVRELYQKDRQGLLAVVLKNKSLAASFQEGQTIADLNSGLSIELQKLKELNGHLSAKLDQTTNKKQTIQAENQSLRARKNIIGDQKSDRQSLLAQTKSQEKLYQEQLSELEKKQEEISGELEKIEEELRRNFNYSLLPLKRPGLLAWPVPNPIITQHYGEVTRYKGRLLYNGKPHNGMDLGVPIGTSVLAADDGVVSAIGNNGRYQYGKYVLVHHANNLATLYAHLSSNNIVKVGDTVTRGQLIGRSGNTGYAFGSGHLHFGLYWDDASLGRNVQLQNLPNCNCGLVPIGIVIAPEDYLPSH